MHEDPGPVPARPSASVLLVRDRPGGLEVLMLTRGAAAVFGSALVFPGGKLDAEDGEEVWRSWVDGGKALDAFERALRIAAWREVFEEVGLLPAALAHCTPAARQGAPFLQVVRESGVRLPLDALLPFGRWITPKAAPQRFDTWFFLSALDAEPACDGYEAVAARWLDPAEALALGEAGACKLMLPTRALLHRLGASHTVDEALAAAAARPLLTVEPRPERRDGRLFMTIPRDAGYDVFEEAM